MLWKYIMYISIKAKNLTYFSNWLLFVFPFCINHTTSSMNQVPKGTATTNGMFHTCLPPGNVIPRVFPPFTVYSPQKVKYPRFVPKPGEFPRFRCLGYIYQSHGKFWAYFIKVFFLMEIWTINWTTHTLFLVHAEFPSSFRRMNRLGDPGRSYLIWNDLDHVVNFSIFDWNYEVDVYIYNSL